MYNFRKDEMIFIQYVQNLAKTRERLMDDYHNGIITSEGMYVLNLIDEQVDLIKKQQSSK